MKRLFFLLVLICFLMFAGTNASANTVSINMIGVEAAGLNIGSFQLFFYTGAGYSFPPDGDFSVTWNSPPQPAASRWYTLDYPVDANLNATGYGAFSKLQTVASDALNDGLVVVLSSLSNFGIDPTNSKNKFYDLFTNAQITGLQISEVWAAGNQTINVSAVPIPAAVWLLGSGIVGLVALKRRKKA